ncbi:MAG: FkbM family methyltransferase [Trichloromonadaceae bacterium]
MNNFSGTGINIVDFLSNQQSVVLFGAGLAGRNALKVLSDKKIQVLFFCDNDKNKHGTDIDGVKVYSPSHLLGRTNEIVLISSDYCGEIAAQLREIGVNNCYYFGFCFDYDRWHGHFDFQRIEACRSRINIAHSLFAEDTSRNLLSSLIEFRYTLGASGGCWSPFGEYFHPLVKPIKGDTIIDGGAWTGDTAEVFCHALNGQCHIYSFEPDEESYYKLTENVTSGHLTKSVYPVKSGLWSHPTTLKFESSRENSMQHQVSEVGDCQIQVTSIDKFCYENGLKVDLIKMDIEGAEIDALNGARETIRSFRPRLQICSYHKFDDLWEIPILIKELLPDYSIYLGHHSQNIFDTIVYAKSL